MTGGMHGTTHLGGIARHPAFEIEILDHYFYQRVIFGLSLCACPCAACKQKRKQQVFHDKYLQKKESEKPSGLQGQGLSTDIGPATRLKTGKKEKKCKI